MSESRPRLRYRENGETSERQGEYIPTLKSYVVVALLTVKAPKLYWRTGRWIIRNERDTIKKFRRGKNARS